MKRIILCLMLIFLLGCSEESKEYVQVTRVVDGDTFVIETGEKVRMILIDTPESVHSNPNRNTEFGKIASDYTTELLEDQLVYLEKDVSDTDRYGRLLRYVYLEDGTFVNELLVKEGYAQIATYPPDILYKDIILEAEKYARENEKGLWSYQETVETIYVGSKKSDKYHLSSCKHVQSIKEENLMYFTSPEDAEDNNYIPCQACHPDE